MKSGGNFDQKQTDLWMMLLMISTGPFHPQTFSFFFTNLIQPHQVWYIKYLDNSFSLFLICNACVSCNVLPNT